MLERAPGIVGGMDPPPILLIPELPTVTLPMPVSLDAPVLQVQTYTGMESDLIERLLDATGARGLVLEGTGAGNVPGSAERGVRAAIERSISVVLATRTISGGTGSHYGGEGGGVSLRALGVLEAGTLTGAKARLLLMSLLSTSRSGEELSATFVEAVRLLAPA